MTEVDVGLSFRHPRDRHGEMGIVKSRTDVLKVNGSWRKEMDSTKENDGLGRDGYVTPDLHEPLCGHFVGCWLLIIFN